MATKEQWAQGLQGMGAWFAGQGPQYEAAKVAQQRTDMQDQLLRDEARQKAMVTDFSRVYAFMNAGKPELAVQLLQNRIPEIQKLYGDPKDSIALLEAVSDPARHDEAKIELEGFLGAAGALPGGGGAKRTDVFKNGAVLQATSDGSINLTLPSGQKIAPADPMWQQAISEATGSGVQYAGDEAAARAYATQGAALSYAAPIAVAQQQGANIGAQGGNGAPSTAQLAADKAAAESAATAAADAKARQVRAGQIYTPFSTQLVSLREAFQGTGTGPIAGRIMALSGDAQKAEAAANIMEPIIKGVVRDAGEGTFTEGDRAQIRDMMPKRTDHPEVVVYKTQLLDNFVRGKLGVPSDAPAAATGGFKVRSVK